MRILRLLTFVVVLLIVAIDGLWHRLEQLFGWIAQLLHLQLIEAWMRKLSPWASVSLLIVPLVIILPIKIVGFWLLKFTVTGGVGVLLFEKMLVVGITTRILKNCKPAMLQLVWFAYIYGKVTYYRDLARSWLHQQSAYLWYKATSQRIKYKVKQVVSRIKHSGRMQ